jgi:hypothetical protein
MSPGVPSNRCRVFGTNTAIPSNNTIGTQSVTDLSPNETLALRFVWDSSGVMPGHWYNITAVASTVPGEVNVTSNVKSSTMLVKVRLLGDVNDDGTVDINDAIDGVNAFGSSPGYPNWNLAADVNNDGVVNILDLIVLASNFGKYVGSDP